MPALDLNKKRVIIAKTASIGDIVIALPLAAAIKVSFPECHVIFLAKGVGCKIAEMYPYIDEVHDWDVINKQGQDEAVLALSQLRADVFLHVTPSHYSGKIAKQAKIPIRIGSLYRWYNWFTCNRLAPISRQISKRNKRQLDLQYLRPLGIKRKFTYRELSELYQFKRRELLLPPELSCLEPQKFKLILHPSLITAKRYQWPVSYYAALIKQLPPSKYQIFISGTANDRAMLQPLLDTFSHVVDLIGKLTLDNYIAFMQRCDGLIAGSTGPLHMAAAAGIHALGIYRANETYIKRWEPVGLKAEVITQDQPCSSCPNGDPCGCIFAISPQQVRQRVEAWTLA